MHQVRADESASWFGALRQLILQYMVIPTRFQVNLQTCRPSDATASISDDGQSAIFSAAGRRVASPHADRATNASRTASGLG